MKTLALAARQFYQTALRTFLKWVKERVLPLVENAKIDVALVAYSKNCFGLGILHHHISQFRAAVMIRWPSSSRSGSR